MTAPAAQERSLAGHGTVLVLILVLGVASPWTAVHADAATGRSTEAEARAVLARLNRTAQQTAYEGLRFVSAWTPTGATSALITVEHLPGRGTIVHRMGRQVPRYGVMYERTTGSGSANLSGATMRLLVDHYQLTIAGSESTVGRPAYVIEARREDGSLAARFWLDHETGLILRREIHDRQQRIIRNSAFIQLRVGESQPPEAERSPPATTARPWQDRLDPRELATLRGRGWAIPRGLPGGLRLVDARQAKGESRVLHLSYSDGLFMVSLFVQRGRLATDRLGGWRKTILDGGCVVYRQHTLPRRAVWYGGGHVYTLVADAPPGKVRQVVAALPHSGARAGFWGRMMRGFTQLGTWLNPFG